MTDIIAIDPGVTSGIVVAHYDWATRVVIGERLEVPGKAEGLRSALKVYQRKDFDFVICEKFRMTPRARTAESVEPLRGEGVVLAHFDRVHWQYPDKMLLAGAGHGSPSRNKTAADNVLRDMGLWTLPSEVPNHRDANDINSAMKHLVAFLRDNDHPPTLEALGVAM